MVKSLLSVNLIGDLMKFEIQPATHGRCSPLLPSIFDCVDSIHFHLVFVSIDRSQGRSSGIESHVGIQQKRNEHEQKNQQNKEGEQQLFRDG